MNAAQMGKNMAMAIAIVTSIERRAGVETIDPLAVDNA